jgi:neurotransmitter:Na+ symporter, NSS family
MSTSLDSASGQRFGSRLGLLLSALGIAVGTGNIWRFPRIVALTGGDDGAGAFLITWVIFLFLWSIPLIIAEYAIGRRCRMGVVGAIMKMAGERLAWMGAFIAFVATAIMFFYSVVVGWCIYYVVYTATHALPLTTENAMAVWDSYQSGGWPLVFHAFAMGVGGLAISRGVSSIERVNKVLIPALLLIVLVSVVRALTLPGAADGIAYLFTPQWDQLAQPRVWLEALTQNAWDTGAGWGLFLTYAAYMRREHGVVKNAFITGIGNNTVSLLAALMVFGTVFSILKTELGMANPEVLEIMRTSGPASTGLTFIWMPQLFARMVFGHPLAVLFFLGLSFAGFSSLIAMLELPVRIVVDAGIRRSRAIVFIVVVSYLLGIPSARNLGLLSNQDFVWGVALMLSGAMVAFAVIRFGVEKIRRQEILPDKTDWQLGRWWNGDLKYIVPLSAFVLLVWWLSLSATVYAPDEWYNPLNLYSVMTCLMQWGIVTGVLLLLNSWFVKRMQGAAAVEVRD